MSQINKYNPNEIEEKKFLEKFVVRVEIFKEIFEDIKTTDYSVPSQHYIIVGQRGQGKTTLLRKLKLEIKNDKKLSSFLVPVQFSEEQYQIRSLSRLWEVVAEYLEGIDENMFGDVLSMMEAHFDDEDYDFNCFGYLEKAIKAKNKKILLLIDNIDEFFNKLKHKEQQQLREILLSSSTFKIIGGSTQMFEQQYDYAKPFYEFFKIIKLKGLNYNETIEFLRVIANDEQKTKIEEIIENKSEKIETLRQLTGGVPRTLVMLFDVFINDNGDAFDDLLKVLDEATPLYKHRMDDLPPVLQEIVHTIALNWDGMFTKEIALKMKLESKEISAQLQQLLKYQMVESVSVGKNNIYKIQERFFNIWYLMRFGRKRDRNRVEWLVRFLTTWYSKEELETKSHMLINACQNGAIKDSYLYHMSEALSYTGMLEMGVEYALKQTSKKYLEKIHSNHAKEMTPSGVELLKKALGYHENGQSKEAIALLEKSQKTHKDILWLLGFLYGEQKEDTKAETYYLKAMESGNNWALNSLSWFYFMGATKSDKALDYAMQSYKIEKNFLNTYTLAIIYLWQEEFSKSYEMLNQWLAYDRVLDSTDGLRIYLILLIAKGQYYKAKELLENKQYELKERVKPIWYALMRLMEKEFPNEIKKMGQELEESVSDILKEIERVKEKYKK